MPLYEYQCRKCESMFELLILGSEQAACPDCGDSRPEKLLSVPAAHTRASSELPVCNGPARGPCGMGGCGMPECG